MPFARKPLEACEPRIDDVELSDDIAAHIEAVQQNWPDIEDRLTEISVETSTDSVIKSIAHFIANGWPSHNSYVPQSVG